MTSDIRNKSAFCTRLFQCIAIGITFLVLSQPVSAQQKDSTQTAAVSKAKKPAKYHSPKKATILSVVLPGLGQAYNHKYWKIPIIYAGFAGLGYVLYFNQNKYTTYRDAYRYRTDNNPETVDNFVGVYSDAQLLKLDDYYHRYRDLSVIGCAAVYFLNVIDANVDAQLFTYDVSDDLSLHLTPNIQPVWATNKTTMNTGLTMTFRFK